MNNAIWYVLLGYISGSILFANLAEKLFHQPHLIDQSVDRNPGVFNAFEYGGWKCGIFTLAGDFLKAFLPVFLYIHLSGFDMDMTLLNPMSALVIAAPVIGHAFPVFYRFQGGKGITASFGSLAALLPLRQPVVSLAGIFLLFTLIVDIHTDYWKTMVVYCTLGFTSLFWPLSTSVVSGTIDICGFVFLRLLINRKGRGNFSVVPFWKSIKHTPVSGSDAESDRGHTAV